MNSLPAYSNSPQGQITGPPAQFRVSLHSLRPGVLAVGFEAQDLFMPDVAGLALSDAAQAWVKAGFYVLPIKAGTKNAGSLLGSGWPQRSSRDLEQVRSWWSTWPDAGIAVHTGRSGVVVADLDVDVLPADLAPLRRAAVQLTRANTSSKRGHYIFASKATFVAGALRNDQGIKVGEIRSGNTVIVAAPTPHANGGLYRPVKALQAVPELTPQVRALLRCPAKAGSFDVEGFKQSYTTGDQLGRLKQVVRRYRKLVSDNDSDALKGKNRHDAMLDVACLALKESRAGAYPASKAIDRLERLWLSSIDGRPNHDLGEFQSMLRYAVSLANADDVEARRQIMARDYGTDTRTTAADLASYYRVKADKEMTMAPSAVRNGHELDDDEDFWKQLDDEEQVVQSLGEIEPQPLRWLWKGWIPLGKVSIFEGESEVGKSTMTIDWAATVSTGRPWPMTLIGGKPLVSQHKPSGVVLVGVEDSAADTVVPRLIAARADRDKIYRLKMELDDSGNPMPFTIEDVSRLRAAIHQAQASLVIIDPITAFLPENVQHNVDASVRRALMPLVVLAEETGAAIVAIRHFNKNTKASAKDRGGGSVAYSALVRSVIQAGKLSETQDDGATHALVLAISNLARKADAIGYLIEDAPDIAELPTPEDEALRVGTLKWCGSVSTNADDLAQGEDSRKKATMRDKAKLEIEKYLADGQPHPSNDVIEAVALAVACSEETVKKAARDLGVIRDKIYEDNKVKCWTWKLDIWDDESDGK